MLLEGFLNNEKEVRDFLQKQVQVKLAYLFGSVAFKDHNELSDIDIGIFLDESLNEKERFNLNLKLIMKRCACQRSKSN